MAPRTTEQKAREAERDELQSLRSQLAFLGGGVCAAIHDGKVDGLAAMIRHIPYLADLPAFKAMMEWMDSQAGDARNAHAGEKPFRPFNPELSPPSKED